jgi:gliding motility-associated-like protein
MYSYGSTLPNCRNISLKLLMAALIILNCVYDSLAQNYHLNGSAVQEDCNCYTLTQSIGSLAGSVWNVNMISLNSPFDFVFSIYLGSKDIDGADGIAFVLQPIGTRIGVRGGGLGFEGVTPSIGITIDTYQNNELNDPSDDHIAIQKNGNLNHTTANNIAGPVTALASSPNIEDGKWHKLRVQWNPTTKMLKAYMDGIERLNANIDLVTSVFGNDPMVFWGFTASTGGLNNLQRVCTELDPQIKNIDEINTCFGTPIQLIDSSSAFSPIVEWQWDFGDGKTSKDQNPPPHLYDKPGNYDAKLRIKAMDGCTSEPLVKKIIVGSDPVPAIEWGPKPACAGQPLTLLDRSTVAFGTMNKWTWTINGTPQSGQTVVQPAGLNNGANKITLQVRTKEGCVSPLFETNINSAETPRVSFSGNAEICLGKTLELTGSAATSPTPVSRWIWQIGSQIDSSGSVINPTFPNPGRFQVTLRARGDNGCLSAGIVDTIHVNGSKAFAGNDTLIVKDDPTPLLATGGLTYRWSPTFGLSDPTIPNPIATLDRDMEYIVTASVPPGCISTDTVKISVFKEINIYVPTIFTPNNDGLNDLLRVIPVGMTLQYFKVYDRWGKLIYQTSDYKKGWDGMLQNRPVPAGTYVWQVQARLRNGQIIQRHGTLQLIR